MSRAIRNFLGISTKDSNRAALERTYQGSGLDTSKNSLRKGHFTQGYGGPGPHNPPRMTTLKLVDVPDAPRLYTQDEANQIEAQTRDIESMGEATERVFECFQRQLEVEGNVHVAHRDLLKKAAQTEYRKVKADTDLGKTLAKLHPKYKGLHTSLEEEIGLATFHGRKLETTLRQVYAKKREKVRQDLLKRAEVMNQ